MAAGAKMLLALATRVPPAASFDSSLCIKRGSSHGGRVAKASCYRPLRSVLSPLAISRVSSTNSADETREEHAVDNGATTSSSRRVAATQLAAACAAVYYGSSAAVPAEAVASEVQKIVKLKNVENLELQEALRAAVVGDLERAESLFTALIEKNPESASVWSNRGSVRLSMGRWEAAADDLTKATELAPYAPVPFLNRAIAFEALGMYAEAIADCKVAIENDPQEYAAWFNLGNVEAKLQDYGAALVAYERAAILAPGVAGYRLREASMLFQLDRSEEAKKVMQGLVRKYPNYAEAHAALAAVLWSENRRSNAEEQFTEALQQEPRFKSMRWVHESLQWPPGLELALENFLAIK